MEKRNVEIKVRLNRKEADALNKRVRKSCLSREAYIRQILNGQIPREAPPPDYYAMMQQLYGIGNNLNQISTKINAGAFTSYNFQEVIDLQKAIYEELYRINQGAPWQP